MYVYYIPNFMSKTLCENLSLTLEERNRQITPATSVRSPVHCILKDVPISFGHVIEPIDFLVIGGSPYEMIIGHPTMHKLY